jgi:hypothetical protein
LRNHFYKYTDIKTAKAILENQSLRFSSPLQFNDPFDTQNEILTNFNMNEFPRVTMSVIEEYIKNDYPLPNPPNDFGKTILFLREGTKSHGYKKDKIEGIILPLLTYLRDELQNEIEKLNSSWNDSLKESRVFCMTEDNDNLLMWAHYAENHTGAVFQLATLAEDDNMLSAARKVEYKTKLIAFCSLEDLIKRVLFDIEVDFSNLKYSSHSHQKSEHWSYEKEWRVVDMCHYNHKKELYVDHKFVPNQLQNIFFGCKTKPEDIEFLSKIARTINPTIGIYQSKKRPLEYALDFEKI